MKTRTLDSPARLYWYGDVLAIIAAYVSTLWLRFNPVMGEPFFTLLNRSFGIRETGVVGDAFRNFYIISGPRITCFLIIILCTMYALWGLYDTRHYIKRRPIAWHILVSNLTALLVFYAYFYLRRNVFHPRSMFAVMLALNTLYAIGLRAVIHSCIQWLRDTRDIDWHPAVLIGDGREAFHIKKLIERDRPYGLTISESLSWKPDSPLDDIMPDLEKAMNRHDATTLIFAEPGISIGQTMQLLEKVDHLDITVKILSLDLVLLATTAKVQSDLIQGTPLIHFSAPGRSARIRVVKLAGSMILAIVLTLLLLPLMLLIAAVIKMTDGGPIFFIQERIGVNRKPFRMIKFRTMRDRAHEEQAQMEEFNESGVGLFKLRKDPRVTWVGRFLRRFSLDELPQLFNVLRGEMTLVGPRPLPRRDFENYYEDWHYGRHNGLPGLSCLWQVSGRSELDFQSMCILDVYYLRNQGLIMDLKILLRTIWVVLFSKGAY